MRRRGCPNVALAKLYPQKHTVHHLGPSIAVQICQGVIVPALFAVMLYQAVSKKSQQCAQMLSTHHKVPSPQCRWIRTERTICAGFAARGRSGQQGRELHWSAPVKLAAVQSSPWLRAGPTSSNKHPHNTQDKGPTHKQPTNQTLNRSTKTKKGPDTRGRRRSRQGPQ